MANVTQTQPAQDAESITPSDTGAIASARGLFVGTGGDVKVDMEAGTTITFSNVISGTLLPVKAIRVYSTGTTASNIVALK